MIDSNTIIRAIAAKIKSVYPNDAAYIDLLPKGFSRPSFFYEKVSKSVEMNTRWTQAVTEKLSITLFGSIDAHGLESQADLLERQTKLLFLLSDPSFEVGDRHIKVTAAQGGMAPYEAYLDVTAEYVDDINEQPPSAETMQEIELTTEV